MSPHFLLLPEKFFFTGEGNGNVTGVPPRKGGGEVGELGAERSGWPPGIQSLIVEQPVWQWVGIQNAKPLDAESQDAVPSLVGDVDGCICKWLFPR